MEERSLKNIRASTGFEPVTSTIPVCHARPTELWSHTLGARSICWIHIFPCSEMMWNIWNSYLHWGCRWKWRVKSENLLRWSLFTFIYNHSTNMNFIYIFHKGNKRAQRPITKQQHELTKQRTNTTGFYTKVYPTLSVVCDILGYSFCSYNFVSTALFTYHFGGVAGELAISFHLKLIIRTRFFQQWFQSKITICELNVRSSSPWLSSIYFHLFERNYVNDKYMTWQIVTTWKGVIFNFKKKGFIGLQQLWSYILHFC